MPAAEAWPFLVAGWAIHNTYYVVLLQAYRFGDLSQVYPLARGVAPVTVAVLAALFAGETPGLGGAAGIALVSLGVVSLMFAGAGPQGGTHQGGMQAGEARKPVILAVVTGLLIASYTVVDGLGMRLGQTVLGYIVWLNIGEGIPFMIAASVMRRRDIGPFLKQHWPRTTGTGVMVVAAYALVLYALGQGAMAQVSALRETSVLFAAIIGWVVLGEPFGRHRITAAAVIVTGVVLLQTAS